MPDVASEPANATATGFVYQPPFSTGRSGVAVTEGAVASYLTAAAAAALTFPATSRVVPETEALAESGPPYEAEVHDAIPDVPSAPTKESAIGLLNQPFASAARL